MSYVTDQRIFKEYVLKGFLGEGSFGQVHLVENRIGLRFALKVLYKGIRMERRGIESVMKIRSNRLVSIQDYGKTVKGEDCVLMEYLPMSLEDVFGEVRTEETLACRYFTEILKGLEVLEANNILHRDIKPANLFVLEDIIKIGDFGTARYTSGQSSVKSSGVGTLHYMAPECFRDNYGSSVDRWAAAVIFYRLLTGKLVFDRTHHAGIFGAIMSQQPDLHCVPDRYRPFLTRCFQKNARDRHSSAKEMLAEIERIVSSTSEGTSRAGVPTQCPGPEPHIYHLRDEPIRSFSEKEFGLDSRLRPLQYIRNEFRDNGNGTVSDHVTGLMWQKAGSQTYMPYKDVEHHISEINRGRFAGYRDWRLPTGEELISLLEPEKQSNGLYIDPIFDGKQCWCWSSDRHFSGSAWHVHFDRGYVHHYDIDDSFYVRAVRS